MAGKDFPNRPYRFRRGLGVISYHALCSFNRNLASRALNLAEASRSNP